MPDKITVFRGEWKKPTEVSMVCVCLASKPFGLSLRFLSSFPWSAGPAMKTFRCNRVDFPHALSFWEGLEKLGFLRAHTVPVF